MSVVDPARCAEIKGSRIALSAEIAQVDEQIKRTGIEERKTSLRNRRAELEASDASLRIEYASCTAAGGPLTDSITAVPSPGATTPGTSTPAGPGLPGAPGDGLPGAPPANVPWGASAPPASLPGSTAPGGGGNSGSVPPPPATGTIAGPATPAPTATKPGLTDKERATLCSDRRATYQRLRVEAAKTRLDIAATELGLASSPSPELRSQLQRELANLGAQQTTVASQISIVGEMIDALDCDKPTATPTEEKKTASNGVPPGLASTERTKDNVPAPPSPPPPTTPPPTVAPPPVAPPTPPPVMPPPSVTTSSGETVFVKDPVFRGVWYMRVLSSQNLNLPLTRPEPAPPPPPPGYPADRPTPWSTTLGMLNLRPIGEPQGTTLAAKEYAGRTLGVCDTLSQYYEGELTWATGGYLQSGIGNLFQSQKRLLNGGTPDRANVIACAKGDHLNARFDGPPQVNGLGGWFELWGLHDPAKLAGDFYFNASRGGKLRAERQ